MRARLRHRVGQLDHDHCGGVEHGGGNYPITLTGNGGGIQQNATVTLTVAATSTTISYVQGNDATPPTPQTTVSVTFTAAQTAGDLNVIIVGWNDSTAVVSAVIDNSGNTYTPAVGPRTSAVPVSQSIYYAKNIASAAAGANVVTVTFSTAPVYPDIRILEYSGADRATQSMSRPPAVAAAPRAAAAPLPRPTQRICSSAPTSFGYNEWPRQRVHPEAAQPQDGDIVEDQMVTATGSYTASAPLSPSGQWIMQMVAFRTPAPNFTLTGSPASVSVATGNQGTFTITTTVSGGFNSAISLSASGAPSGTTVSFNPSTIAAPGTGNSTMTITVGAGTALGTYPITVTGNAGGTQDPATVNLTVTGTPTFTLSASPASTSFGNVMLGSSSTLPVILTNTGTGSVTISQDSVTGSGFSISGPASLHLGGRKKHGFQSDLCPDCDPKCYRQCVYPQQRHELPEQRAPVRHRHSRGQSILDRQHFNGGWLQRLPRRPVRRALYNAELGAPGRGDLRRQHGPGRPDLLLCDYCGKLCRCRKPVLKSGAGGRSLSLAGVTSSSCQRD